MLLREAPVASVVFAYADNAGTMHSAPIDAAVADIATILGRIGADSGIAAGIARKIIDKRADLEAVFAELDQMVVHASALGLGEGA